MVQAPQQQLLGSPPNAMRSRYWTQLANVHMALNVSKWDSQQVGMASCSVSLGHAA